MKLRSLLSASPVQPALVDVRYLEKNNMYKFVQLFRDPAIPRKIARTENPLHASKCDDIGSTGQLGHYLKMPQRWFAGLFISLALAACGGSDDGGGAGVANGDPGTPAIGLAGIGNVIPKPSSFAPATGNFTLTRASSIYVLNATPETLAIGQYLADKMRPATGYANLQTAASTTSSPGDGNIVLQLGGDATLGDEGYALNISTGKIELSANKPAGLFRGIQTIRQMFPAEIESSSVKPVAWTLPAGLVTDSPRFKYRGSMLDTGRQFYTVAEVKKFIDEMAYFKFNNFHFHLTDNESWRIAINSWPLLTSGGRAASEGHYTQNDYSDIVKYASARYINVVPEIDLPGHTDAAQLAYPILECGEKTDTDLGKYRLCTNNQFNFIGNWKHEPNTGSYQDDYTYSSSEDASYTVSFNGTQAKIYTSTDPKYGIMSISVDDGPESDEFDAYSSGHAFNVLAYTTPILDKGDHKIKVRVTGKKNPNSSAYSIVADRVVVSNGATDTATINDDKTATFQWIKDVIREVAAITPGEYIHIGGDEADVLGYNAFIEQVQEIANLNGKKILGWEEMSNAKLASSSAVQVWTDVKKASAAIASGHQLIMSPCANAYLDMRYPSGVPQPYGKDWCGALSVQNSYAWDPTALVAANLSTVNDSNILGVEGPFWADTKPPYSVLETQVWPRLAGIAEVGWSSKASNNWADYSARLANHGARWQFRGVNFYPSGEVSWVGQDGKIAVDDQTLGTSNSQFEYVGSWTKEFFPSAYGDTDTYSNTTDSYVNFRFKGTQVALISAQASAHGIIAVSIDGGSETHVDLYSPTRVNNTNVYTSPTLASGSHIMKVRVTGLKNSSDGGVSGLVDGAIVTP